MTQMTTIKKCFTIVHCELHGNCALSQADYRNGYFNPRFVGEHCDSYVPADELTEKLIRMAGANE